MGEISPALCPASCGRGRLRPGLLGHSHKEHQPRPTLRPAEPRGGSAPSTQPPAPASAVAVMDAAAAPISPLLSEPHLQRGREGVNAGTWLSRGDRTGAGAWAPALRCSLLHARPVARSPHRARRQSLSHTCTVAVVAPGSPSFLRSPRGTQGPAPALLPAHRECWQGERLWSAGKPPSLLHSFVQG